MPLSPSKPILVLSLIFATHPSQATVAKYMVHTRRPPVQTWYAFLNNHVDQLVSTDFFVVLTATFRLLFVFVVLAHQRRRVVHFNVTANQTAEWTARQIAESPGTPHRNIFCMIETESMGTRFDKPSENWARMRFSRLHYYQGSRTHLSLGKDSPEERAVQLGAVIEIVQVGGLHHRYERRAA